MYASYASTCTTFVITKQWLTLFKIFTHAPSSTRNDDVWKSALRTAKKSAVSPSCTVNIKACILQLQ